MMNNGDLYQRSNEVQRRDAKQMLAEFGPQFQWRADGRDSLLDIGCGTGDVTIDYILPMLPPKFTRLVGVDISDGMLGHARNNYVQQHSKIAFEKLDIGRPLDVHAIPTAFDHITSFYCLHWVQNQKQAIQNIYDLLSAGGDCLLVFLAANPLFQIFKQICVQPRWAGYLPDVSSFISPYQFSNMPAEDLGRILDASGFTEKSVQVRDQQFVYGGMDILRKSVRAVSPFFERMPMELHEDFLDDYIEIVRAMHLVRPTLDGDDCEIISPYKLLIAYARK